MVGFKIENILQVTDQLLNDTLDQFSEGDIGLVFVRVVHMFDELGDAFGISLGFKSVAFLQLRRW